jgi:tRNA G18 (ribose-2'-O)-methylase SpoU
METPLVNYQKIINDTASKHFNVADVFKDNSVEENIELCKQDRLPFSVGAINITGDLNIGMMIRSACLMGASNFYIFGRKKYDKRSTVGAENYTNIVQYKYENPLRADEQLLIELRKLNTTHRVLLCEQGGMTLGHDTEGFYASDPRPPLFLFGSESHGIPELILNQKVDSKYDVGWNSEFERISIPQRGVLRSFNVSSAMNIIIWDYCKEMYL